MTRDANLPASPSPTPTGPARRKGPPAWGVALFLVLLGGIVVVNQLITTSGPPIAWMDDDVAAALRRADQKGQRVFLYLFEPNDPIYVRNERQVFTQRWAREPLQGAVCCRVALATGDVRRVQYKYDGQPLFLLLNSKGQEMARTQGPVSQLEFETYIGRPVEGHLTQKQESP